MCLYIQSVSEEGHIQVLSPALAPGNTVRPSSSDIRFHMVQANHIKGRPLVNQTTGMRHGYGRLLAAANDEPFHGTPGKIALSVFLFLAAGLCEIGGGWLIWHALRGGLVPPPERWWQSPTALLYIAAGGVTLVGYGYAPFLPPSLPVPLLTA